MKSFLSYIILCIALLNYSLAQSPYQLIEKGNKLVKKEAFEDAEVSYRKAIEQRADLPVAEYNVGITKYSQDNPDKAIERFTKAAEKFETPEDKAHAFHNLGNTYLNKQSYEESIAAYKEALKLVPGDLDTKYNLAYAQLMLKKEQEQEQEEQQEDNQEQQQDEQDQDQEREENQEEEEKEQEGNDQEQEQDDQGEEEQGDEEGDEEDEQQEEEQGDKDNQEQEGENEKEQQRPSQLSKEQADQLLQMLENEEGKLQEKLDEPEGEAVKIIIEKDW